LAERDRVLICYLLRGDRLTGLVVGAGRTQVVQLGAFGAIAEIARRLLADLDAVAGRALPERLEAAIRASIQRHVTLLDDELLRPFEGLLGAGSLVIVPTGILAALPWSMLPRLRTRPVTVAPSATAWLNTARLAEQPPVAGIRRTPGPLLVAGPHLLHAEAELDEIAKLYPDHRTLRGERATVAAALAGLEGAPMAHLAAHGHHEPDNGLFSRLDLADGPLMVYDMQQLAGVPRLITLSACDVGRAVVTPGDEFLGFTAALLHAGTACVVSSVTRVVHETAAMVMTALHRALAGGASPSAALTEASANEPLATFVCFGAG
jgi:CHAT domain-containing protein